MYVRRAKTRANYMSWPSEASRVTRPIDSSRHSASTSSISASPSTFSVSARHTTPSSCAAGRHCTNSRSNKLCTRRMCRRHCLAAGGCKCPGHQEPDDEDVPPALRPHAKLRAYEQREHKAEQASISTTPRPFTSYDDLLNDALYPLAQLHAYQQRERAAEQAMDNALGLRLPSPDISLEDALLQQEADDLAEAIHHSKLPRHKPFTGVSAVLSSPPPPIGQYVTRTLKLTGLPTKHYYPLHISRPPIGCHRHHQARRCDSAIHSRDFRKVLQRRVNRRAKSASPTAPTSPSGTFTTPQRFSGCSLHSGITMIDRYSQQYHFIEQLLNDPHTVSTDSVVILRCQGITGYKEIKTIKHFVGPVPAYLRYDTTGPVIPPSSSSHIIVDNSSDNDVLIINYIPALHISIPDAPLPSLSRSALSTATSPLPTSGSSSSSPLAVFLKAKPIFSSENLPPFHSGPLTHENSDELVSHHQRARLPKSLQSNPILRWQQHPSPFVLIPIQAPQDHLLALSNLTWLLENGRLAGKLKLIHRGVYDSNNLFDEDLDPNSVVSRMEFIQLRDIHRRQKEIEAETVRLDRDDGISTLRWVNNLRAKDSVLGFKSRTNPPPPDSGLNPDVFTLMIQTRQQRRIFTQYGQSLMCIDGTHNVSMYENLTLTTLLVRDRWAHGIPIAWMLASSGTQETIRYFLKLHCTCNSLTIPARIISDFD
ncbi:hypothetical protein DFH07DRAFT_773516 [Mycena maculata]|uniref:MULE transposase domain-containing protein n=1 Tax=Mycena maculata TaxID=230809 RepID=A0AAD7J4L1_9AGAR|nr:hypothetical protein DFH07DRAFT_773516 [Mycena maculata]